jgi:hypothetical protein
MSNDDIIKAFNGAQLYKSNSIETLDESSVDRESHIIPDSKFLTKDQVQEFKEKKKIVKFSEEAVKYVGKGDVDLRSKDSQIENQWDGTCTAHSMRNVLDNKLDKGKTSTRHIWSKYKQYSCEAAVKATLGKSCVTSTDKWPHKFTKPLPGYLDKKYCNSYLTKAPYIGTSVQKAITALDNSSPVYLGIRVTKSMLNCSAAINPTSDAVNGGHALAILGYKFDDRIVGGGYFIIKNSWGTDCGDKGYQYLPFHHCTRKDLYCVMWSIDEVKRQ